ncbi:MAG: VirB4 family type IV secretion system protein [Microbacteriaceae bacterium]
MRSRTNPEIADRGRAWWRPAPGVGIERHRATMAHLASVYPFHADAGFGERGPYIGVNVTGGGSGFFYDPFELYPTFLTNPSVLVVGDIGSGKSALVKTFLGRQLAVYGTRRQITILDPKGEYTPFADACGLSVIRLRPGGSERLNPFDTRGDRTETVRRQSLATALVGGVLGRRLDPTEDAVLGWAITRLARLGAPFTLADVAATLADPADELLALSRRTPLELVHAASPVVFAVDKLLTGALRGMFDGPTTVAIDWETGPGFVIDLSAVWGDDEALPLVMLAATSWLAATLRRDSPRRVVQVIDEAWAAVRHGAHHFQATLKLSRAYGVSTWLVCHRPADLTAQTDDGTATAKIAAGLLSDIQTRILFRQPPDQVATAAELFGLSERERDWIGQLVRGRAVWRLQRRGAVVHTVLTERERLLADTDAAMT